MYLLTNAQGDLKIIAIFSTHLFSCPPEGTVGKACVADPLSTRAIIDGDPSHTDNAESHAHHSSSPVAYHRQSQAQSNEKVS